MYICLCVCLCVYMIYLLNVYMYMWCVCVCVYVRVCEYVFVSRNTYIHDRDRQVAHIFLYSDGIWIVLSAHSLVTLSWQPNREVS